MSPLVVALVAFVAADSVEERFAVNAGYERVAVKDGSFGAFLRALPLLPAGTPVTAFDGRIIDAPWARAVVDLDVGSKDLQQCADSAIRLWAEYRFARGDADIAGFVIHATSGDPLPWARYRDGDRPVVKGNRISWQTKKAAPSSSKATFRAYLDAVFMWAGSKSLKDDTVAVEGSNVEAGDLLVVGGSPGHVLVVLDVARAGAKQQLLIGEGYMPAQSFHVLGWFDVADDGSVVVPSWSSPFERSTRRRFK